MLIVALVLAVIGLAALVTAVVTSNEVIAWVCIAASVIGVVLLIIDALRERSKGEASARADDEDHAGPAAAEAEDYPEEAPAEHEDAVQHHEEAHEQAHEEAVEQHEETHEVAHEEAAGEDSPAR
jgi:ABC-type nickel/cobalt efflux system permease component RcnA